MHNNNKSKYFWEKIEIAPLHSTLHLRLHFLPERDNFDVTVATFWTTTAYGREVMSRGINIRQLVGRLFYSITEQPASTAHPYVEQSTPNG
jgi:hypothetical protein